MRMRSSLAKSTAEARINTSVSTRPYARIDFERKGVEWVLRLSPHCYNTEDEIDRAAATIGELAREPAP